MDGKEAREMLEKYEAIVSDGHFVYESKRHGSSYVNKDAIYPHTQAISTLCRAIAEIFRSADIDIVVGPEKGGIITSQWVAYHLSHILGREVLSVYAERSESTVFSRKDDDVMAIQDLQILHYPHDTKISLQRGDKLIKRSGFFIFKRNYGSLVAGKNVLVVEDILTTCKTVKSVVAAVRAANGTVVGIGALCDRSTPETRVYIPNQPRTVALVTMPLETMDAHECQRTGLCAKGIPIRTDLGKGADFLASKKSA